MNIEEKQRMLKEYEESLKGKTLEELEKIESESSKKINIRNKKHKSSIKRGEK